MIKEGVNILNNKNIHIEMTNQNTCRPAATG